MSTEPPSPILTVRPSRFPRRYRRCRGEGGAGRATPAADLLASVAWLLYQREMIHDPAALAGWDTPVCPVHRARLAGAVHSAVPGLGYDIDLEASRHSGTLAGLCQSAPSSVRSPGWRPPRPSGSGFRQRSGMAMAAPQHGLLDAGTLLASRSSTTCPYRSSAIWVACRVVSPRGRFGRCTSWQPFTAIYDDNDISDRGRRTSPSPRTSRLVSPTAGRCSTSTGAPGGPDGSEAMWEDLQVLHEAIVAAPRRHRASIADPAAHHHRLAPRRAGPGPSSHGAKLGAEEIAGLKRPWDWILSRPSSCPTSPTPGRAAENAPAAH